MTTMSTERGRITRVVAMTTQLFWDADGDDACDDGYAGDLDTLVTELVFDVAAPYEVTMTTYRRGTGAEFDVDRTFAREVLAGGLQLNTIGSEVGVSPDRRAPGWIVVTIHPGRPDAVDVPMPRSEVEAFLADTYAACPRERETAVVDWDATIGRLLRAV